MSKELKVGSIYRSITGVNFEIIKLLGAGGQGNVYLIDYNVPYRGLWAYRAG